MTISDLSIYNSLVNQIDQTYQNMQTAQQQLSSGKRVLQPSDDPAAYGEASLLTAAQTAASNDGTLANQVQNQLQMASDSLSQAAAALTAAISNATQGADGTVNTQQMTAIAQSVQGQLNQIIQSANLQVNGASVFAGNQSGGAAYDSSGNYQGDTGSNSAVFSDASKVQLTFDGQTIFGDVSSGAIGALNSLITALNSGDKAGVAAALPELNSALQQVAVFQAGVGASLQQVAQISSDSTTAVTALETAVNNTVGADVTQVAATLSEDTNLAQALVQVASNAARIPQINVLV